MTNWTSQIPAKTRTTLYLIFGVISVATGTVTTWYSTTTGAVPAWVTGVTAVLAYVGGALGFVAAGNTDVSPGIVDQYDGGPTIDDGPVQDEDAEPDTDPETVETEADREPDDTPSTTPTRPATPPAPDPQRGGWVTTTTRARR